MLYATVRQRKIHVKNPVTVIQNGIGVDQVVLDMDDEWKTMTSIVCVFQNGDTAKEQLYSYGQLLEVPWECLTQTGRLSLSCTGYVGSEKVMTTMLPDSYWNVVQNGPVTGDVPLEPTPTLYEQILEAAAAANATAEQLLTDKENGVFDGRDGTSVAVESTAESNVSGGENTVTFSDGSELTVKNGKDGRNGSDGENGGFYVPTVTQVDDNTVSFGFVYSDPPVNTVAIPEKTITLPSGKDGEDYVLTEADKAEIAEQAAQLVTVPDAYTKAEINAIMGSYITDIDTLLGGDA